jgi:uncharacterized protein YdeI (YjbR/CyaY-like superfamily)
MDDVVEFQSAKDWERWLGKNHAVSKGAWIRFYKKGSGVASLSSADALDAALCYGWITGQAKPYDDRSWLVRFVPRRPRSMWSKVNTRHAQRLIRERRMKPTGLVQIEQAKLDGRWDRAYSPQSTGTPPAEFIKELNKKKEAKAFFETLNRANVYSIVFRLENAKDAKARKAKIDNIVRMLERHEKFH